MTDSLSLSQLNGLIRNAIKECFPERYWVHAELSEVHENYSSGHCYLELIEKEHRNGQTVAKARAVIWSGVYRLLKPYFEKTTGQSFGSGIKVLVEVSIEFHELYGFSLTVYDIDPVYTVGDMVRHRREILARLAEEGVIDMNKELSWPELPQRIAVISSATAAGYGDFCSQLLDNTAGYRFYPVLFSAVMQGQQAEDSIIQALERIFRNLDRFDVVVIIRGGGSTSDLNCFDSYRLAQHVAQFPLPIVTGIGHERDDTVIDSVAHLRVKTPTAAAEYLIGSFDKSYARLISLRQEIERNCRLKINHGQSLLEKWQSRIPQLVQKQILQQRQRLQQLQVELKRMVNSRIRDERNHLEHIEQLVMFISPDTILKKGYSLTLKNGKAVRSADELNVGDTLFTLFGTGETQVEVKKIKGKE